MYIGKKIKELRKKRKLTLVELSQQSGVQVATLSRIENDKMTGSVESHMNISRALGVDITQLYSNIARGDKRVDLNDTSAGKDVFVHSKNSSSEMLTSGILSKQMMPVLTRIEAGGQTDREQNKIGTEKFLYVLEGSIEVTIGEDKYKLEKDAALYFDASLAHFLRNNGEKIARVIVVVTPVAL